MASISDVAKRAGVGVGTVSRVLNGTGYVADKTREKVEKAIKDLHYVPNELARNLTTQRSHTIAVIVPDISNMFFANLVNEIERNLRQQGYKTMLCNCNGEKTNEKAFIELLDRNLVDGVITASNLLRNENYAKITKPMVSIDSLLSPSIPAISSDHREGGRLAAKLLIDAGCKNVLQFRDSVDHLIKTSGSEHKITVSQFPYVLRHIEFEKAIKEAGIEYHEILPYEDFKGDAKAAAEEALRRFPDIDGFMATDIPAVHFAKLALEKGKKIPEDIQIVAYDGTQLSQMFYPSLSAIVQPVPKAASLAVELVLKQIAGEKVEQMNTILPVDVIDHTGNDH